jgi:hypothetical protein
MENRLSILDFFSKNKKTIFFLFFSREKMNGLEITRLLKLEIIDYFSKNGFHPQMWPEIFKVSVKLCRNILEKKSLENKNSEREVVLISIETLKELFTSSDDLLQISKKDKEFLNTIVEEKGGIYLLQFYYQHSDEKKETDFEKRNRLLTMMIDEKVDFKDELSDSIYSILKQQVNLLTIDQSNWPIIISTGAKIVKSITPQIKEDRQKEILYEVLNRIITILGNSDTRSGSFIDIGQKETNENTILKSIIGDIYGSDILGDHPENIKNTIPKKGKCCVIM